MLEMGARRLGSADREGRITDFRPNPGGEAVHVPQPRQIVQTKNLTLITYEQNHKGGMQGQLIPDSAVMEKL